MVVENFASYIDGKSERYFSSAGSVTLHNIKQARFLHLIKIIIWITIGFVLKSFRARLPDYHQRNKDHKLIDEFGTPAAIIKFCSVDKFSILAKESI